jgi:hypothetical protein
MGVDDSTKIILGSLRNATSPNVDMLANVTLEQTQKENVEFDRSSDINLQQIFVDERESSLIFRPVTKYVFIFENTLVGSTTYPPYRNNLYYSNAIPNAVSSITNPNTPWEGYPQYFEFEFIRTDNNVQGYTQPPNNHLNFVNKRATNYNWTHYMSYAFDNNPNKQLSAIDEQTNASWFWTASDGIPFIIDVGSNNNDRVISFRTIMPHGVNVGDYVELTINYNNNTTFLVSSLGNEGSNSEEYIFNIDNIGYTGTTFLQGTTGTFKRIIDISNQTETTSTYYVRRHKILTESSNAVIVKAGFEQNSFTSKVKFEPTVLTPNNMSRTSIKEGNQSYTLSFNTDIDISNLIDNQKRPITELYFTTVWKGFFGWTRPLRQGYDFNLPLVNNQPSPWWNINNVLSNTNISTNSYTSLFVPSAGNFIYNEDLNVGDIIDGDFCEFNNYEQKERVISTLYHKITYNPTFFSLTGNTNINNPLGYYYKPHNPITLRVFSDYIEEADSSQIVNLPDYAFYSNLSNSFRWRDLYPIGFIDGSGLGVDYPFINGKQYPYVNTIFRLIPEGTQRPNKFINDINLPTIDECE